MGEKIELLDIVLVEGYVYPFTVVAITADELMVIGGFDRIRYVFNPNKYKITILRKYKAVDSREMFKMYVLVRNSAPIGLGINSIGHVVCDATLKYNHMDSFKDWRDYSNKQVSCLVNDEDFLKAIDSSIPCVTFSEPDWRDSDNIISVAFVPQIVFPSYFKEFDLTNG